ncbi:MAG: FixH family protein [Bacteroidota bacterium]
MTWGTKIILAFACFVTLIISMVVISMRQDVNLVAKDYYVQEIAYQDQIDRIKNHNNAEQLILTHNKADQKVKLEYLQSNKIDGEVLFFRPSDASKDLRYKLTLSEQNQQIFDTRKMQRGLWKVKINWKEGEREFYQEKTIII